MSRDKKASSKSAAYWDSPNRAGRSAGKVSSSQRRYEGLPAPGVQRKGAPGGDAGTDVQAVAAAGVAGTGQPLPHLDKIQAAFGCHDVSGIDAHIGGRAAQASEQIGASAYAMGNSVAFGGQPDLHTAAHEAAHVVQQRAGVQLKGGVGEVGDKYEQHADLVADLVVQGKSAAALLSTMSGSATTGVQTRAVQKFNRHKSKGPEGKGPNTVDAGAATLKDSTKRDFAALSGGTMNALSDHADVQADWSFQIADATQRKQLRDTLVFLRGQAYRSTAIGQFKVSDFISHGLANKDAVDAYCNARTETTPTVRVNAAADVDAAAKLGADIRKLEAAMQGPVLKFVVPAAQFDALRAKTLIDKFANYVTTCDPLLHAHDGKEVKSFMELAKTADPASFNDIADVRNYHRFQEAALSTLRTNQAGNTTGKPMTLVLHSALDHNGAFHQDPEMTAVIKSGTAHTIMVEGVETLAAISGRLPALVEKHGREEPDPADASKKVKRIDQLLLAGHGSPRSLAIAGSLKKDKAGKIETNADGKPKSQTDGLNLNSTPGDQASIDRAAKSRKFLQELVGFMTSDPTSPHGRIVGNACLTAANEVDPKKVSSADPVADQQQQIKNAIANNPSIVEAMRKMAKDQGKGTTVLGGNGSFGVVGLINSTGALDIIADGTDPDGDGKFRGKDLQLTNPDKFVYVEKGKDPDGCMSSLVECWGKDRAKALKAVKARRASPLGGGWKEKLLQTFYELVETTYSNNGARIAELAGAIFGFEQLGRQSSARVWNIWNFTTDWQTLFDRLHGHATWTGNKFVPLVFFQAWMWTSAAKKANFLTELGGMTCREAQEFVTAKSLKNMWTDLLPATAATPPNPGRLRLALIDLIQNRSSPHARTVEYLKSLIVDFKFTVDLKGPTGGLMDNNAVLMALGAHKRQQPQAPAKPKKPAGAGAAPPAPDGNVDMTNDDKNESLVESMSTYGTVTASRLYARAQASLRGRPHKRLFARGERVHIMGKAGDWYLVDMDGERAYSHSSYIKLD